MRQDVSKSVTLSPLLLTDYADHSKIDLARCACYQKKTHGASTYTQFIPTTASKNTHKDNDATCAPRKRNKCSAKRRAVLALLLWTRSLPPAIFSVMVFEMQ